jgi:hypothetical protein
MLTVRKSMSLSAWDAPVRKSMSRSNSTPRASWAERLVAL